MRSPRWLVIGSLLTAAAVALSQQEVPEVGTLQVPTYPAIARLAELEGDVRLKVTTNGLTVVATEVESGQSILARSAEDNVKTRKFVPHQPTAFSTVFSFRLDKEYWTSCGSYRADNGQVVLKLPTQVTIIAHIELRSACDPNQGLDLSEPLKVFLTGCQVDGSPTSCEKLIIRLHSGAVETTPQRFEESKERQGFIVPEELRSLKSFDVSVDTGHGAFTANAIDGSFLKGKWRVGIDHRPFKENTPIYDPPANIRCAGFIEFEGGEPEVVVSAPCQ